MKLYDVFIGGIIGTILGLILAQSFDLVPSIVAGAIMGISIAFGSNTMSKQTDS